MHFLPELIDDADQLTEAPAIENADVFGDIPGWIWTAFLSTWALLFALFVVFFTTDGPATLAVLTSSFFALMLLGLPAALGAQARSTRPVRSRIVVTRNGPIPVGAAATQILLIPVAGVIGLAGFIVLAL